jgi:hypothetical protein
MGFYHWTGNMNTAYLSLIIEQEIWKTAHGSEVFWIFVALWLLKPI